MLFKGKLKNNKHASHLKLGLYFFSMHYVGKKNMPSRTHEQVNRRILFYNGHNTKSDAKSMEFIKLFL